MFEMFIFIGIGAALMYFLDPKSGKDRSTRFKALLKSYTASPQHDGQTKAEVHSETERYQREQKIDQAVEDSFPASDPPSTSPLKPDKTNTTVPAGNRR